jgi:RNA polymerase sigma-70 factor (ECF subfamily)
MAKTDAELLRADASGFRELYGRYAERIHGYHLRRCGNLDAAHDLTAETFAQAWLARRRFRDEAGGSISPWLYGIARNVLLESVRRGRIEREAAMRLGVFERLDREPAAVEPDEAWLDGLDDALADLSDAERAAIELRVVEGLDYDAVAAALSTTAPAARVRVSRGLAALRHRLLNGMEAAR